MATFSPRLLIPLSFLMMGGCGASHVDLVKPGKTARITVEVANEQDSGARIQNVWVSYAAPSPLVFRSSAPVSGLASIGIGEVWTSTGEFTPTSDFSGCAAAASKESIHDAVYPEPEAQEPAIDRFLIYPRRPGFWWNVTMPFRRLACAARKFRVTSDWRWTDPPPDLAAAKP